MEFSGGQHHTVCLDAEGKVQLTGFSAPNLRVHFLTVDSSLNSMQKKSTVLENRIFPAFLEICVFVRTLTYEYCCLGQVYSLGRAEYGRLGLGQGTKEKNEPTLVTGIEAACNVTCGASVSYAVTREGEMGLFYFIYFFLYVCIFFFLPCRSCVF